MSLILTILAVILWTLSISQAELTIGFYGLIHSYPIIYFVSLGLLTIASFMLWTERKEHGRLLFLQLCLFITFLWLTPILIGSNPVSTVWTYSIYFPNSDAIVQSGHISPDIWMMQNWPLAFILESTIMKFLNVNTADFMAFYSPIIMQFIIMLPLYLFFKNTINNINHRLAACWVFYLANWTAQIYFDPQGIGLFFLFTLLALVSSLSFWEKGVASFGRHVTSLFILAGLAVVHFLTSVVAFLSLAVWWLTRRFNVANLLVLAVAFVMVWSIYGATTQLDFNLPRYLERAFRLDLVFKFAGMMSHENASSSYLAVTFSRYIFSVIFAVVAIIGFFLSLRYKEKSDYLVLLVIIPSFFILLSMVYGNEFWIRAFIFSLMPIAYFSIKLLKTKISAVVFCLLILVVLPLNTISHFGSVTVDYQPSGEIAYWHFTVNNSIPGDVLGGTRIYYPDYSYTRDYLDTESLKNGKYILKPFNSDRPQYFHVGYVDSRIYEFNRNDTSLVPQTHIMLEQSSYYSLIYNNPDVDLYVK
jgi:hypothetical protein